MRAVIAPDSFKGSLSAAQAARAMARGLAAAGWTEWTLCPIADGGEGTTEALCLATGGRIIPQSARDPLGRPHRAFYGRLGDGRTAVVEVAAASGLTLVGEGERDILRADSYGTGELIRAALRSGAERIILGLGGSATNDGGAGLLRALGFRFLDAAGAELPPGGAALARLCHIEPPEDWAALRGASFLAACDVRNPLCGAEGAAAVYGPQKGASPSDVARLDAALARFAAVLQEDMGADIAELPGAGAAGGIGGGAVALLGARLVPGFALVAQETGLEKAVAGADLVLTGEGRTDAQTLFGKVPQGVGRLARAHGVPAVCLSGGLGAGWEGLMDEGVTACFSVCDGPMPLGEALARAEELLETAARAVGRLALAGARLLT